MQAAVSQRTCSKLSTNPQGDLDKTGIQTKLKSHLFFPSVFTLIGEPRRDGWRKIEVVAFTVSVDFQLSVLELVAELLRAAASFLVIIDQYLSL